MTNSQALGDSLTNSAGSTRLRHAFATQRCNARRRGIDWQLTFADWLRIWSESGRISERGRGRGRYVMARRGDAGPYAAGNVSIQRFEDNARDSALNLSEEQRRVGPGRGRDWAFIDGRFRSVDRARYVGSYGTKAEAIAASDIAYQANLARIAAGARE